MRQLVTSVLLAAATFAAGIAFAQADHTAGMTKNAQSPASQAGAMVKGKEVYVLYHAPSVRGRHVFGGADALQPDDSIWRAGADTATLLHTDVDLTVGKLSVPAGEYSLYVFLDKGKWELIVNKQTKQWGILRTGATTDDPAQELGRTAMSMSKNAAPVEVLKYDLAGGKLTLSWADMIGSVPYKAK
jgi:hypothetical protein